MKTRRQMIGQTATLAVDSCDHAGFKEYAAGGPGRLNAGTFGHMQHIVQQEGMAGLWKGNVTRMVKVAPA